MSNHPLFNIFMAIWNQPGGDTVLNLLEVKPTDLGCFGDLTGPERSIPEKLLVLQYSFQEDMNFLS